MPAIRDPVHTWIYCSEGEQAVVDTNFFQRLNWVSQLTLVKCLYPGGTHTRFSHSLGAMKIAGDYMENLFRDLQERVCQDPNGLVARVLPSQWERQHLTKIARFCGLLHDIGHGPFSHAFDRAIYSQIYGIDDGGHDLHRALILKHPSIAAGLRISGVRPEELLAVWDESVPEFRESSVQLQDWYRIIRAVIGGPLGADRMDFTMRDSYFTGTQHAGTIAKDRILHHVGVAVINESSVPGEILMSRIRLRLCYSVKVIDDMIQALDGRHWMYNNVYLHKTSSATHILIEQMLRAADKPLGLTNRVWDLERFAYLNENTLMGEIMTWNDQSKIQADSDESGGTGDMVLAEALCKAIFDRRFPKLLHERRYHEPEDYEHENPFAEYLDKPEYAVVKTRYIAGVDSTKFNKYGILFKDKDKAGSYLQCQEVLDRMGYDPPQAPYFYVRVYSLPDYLSAPGSSCSVQK